MPAEMGWALGVDGGRENGRVDRLKKQGRRKRGRPRLRWEDCARSLFSLSNINHVYFRCNENIPCTGFNVLFIFKMYINSEVMFSVQKWTYSLNTI